MRKPQFYECLPASRKPFAPNIAQAEPQPPLSSKADLTKRPRKGTAERPPGTTTPTSVGEGGKKAQESFSKHPPFPAGIICKKMQNLG